MSFNFEITCPECGEDFASSEGRCPNCDSLPGDAIQQSVDENIGNKLHNNRGRFILLICGIIFCGVLYAAFKGGTRANADHKNSKSEQLQENSKPNQDQKLKKTTKHHGKVVHKLDDINLEIERVKQRFLKTVENLERAQAEKLDEIQLQHKKKIAQLELRIHNTEEKLNRYITAISRPQSLAERGPPRAPRPITIEEKLVGHYVCRSRGNVREFILFRNGSADYYFNGNKNHEPTSVGPYNIGPYAWKVVDGELHLISRLSAASPIFSISGPKLYD